MTAPHRADLEAELQATQERVRELEEALAECYRLTGSDPDGDSDSHLAKDAVQAVRELREENERVGEWEDRAVQLQQVIDGAIEAFELHNQNWRLPGLTQNAYLGAASYLRDKAASTQQLGDKSSAGGEAVQPQSPGPASVALASSDQGGDGGCPRHWWSSRYLPPVKCLICGALASAEEIERLEAEGEIAGISRYEADEHPTLIFHGTPPSTQPEREGRS